MEVTLPSHLDLTVLVDILIGGHPTDAVVDSAAMVTLVREDLIGSRIDPKNIGPLCVLSGIGSDPVHGRLVHNVPIPVGTQTFLHTVCVDPIKDNCLLGLDFMIATGSVLDLSRNTLTVEDDVMPIRVIKHPGLQASNVSIVRRTVIQPQSVGFVPAKLDSPIDGSYIVSGASNKKALVSNVFCNGVSVILIVVNDSNGYVTFKKGKSIGHAESAELVHNNAEHLDINITTQSGAEQAGTAIRNLPKHLEQMYSDNISNLLEKEKLQFKELITEYQDVFSKEDFDLGCISSGVEHKIQTHDEIHVAEKNQKNSTPFSETGKRIN